jgi:hypothetical protein
MAKVINPYPIFLDGRGALLDSGFIYIGQPNKDPTIPGNQYQLYWDPGYSIPAPQPLRTLGGRICQGQNPAFVYINQPDYSMTIKDADGVLVLYTASFANTGDPAPSYQPLDSDLTAIAALGTTPFGRNLLTLANAAALAAATGIPTPLPLAGGSVTGPILRQGAGILPYYNDPGMTGGRIFLTAVGAADPTSQPGDQWLQY